MKYLVSRTALRERIEAVVRLVGEGFKDNEIVALRKINANRAALVVEQLALIRKHLALVEREMQKAAAQKDMLAAARWETAQPCTARWSFCVNYLGRGARPYDWVELGPCALLIRRS